MPALDNVGAAIAEVIQPYIEDVVFSDFALLAWMEANGRVMTQDPSLDITWPITKDKANTGTYRGFYKFPGTEKQVLDKAKVEWKQAYADIAVSAYDALRARGVHAAYVLTDALKQNAKMSISEEMGRQIYANGQTNMGWDWDGLAVASDDGTIYPTYAQLPRSAALLPGWNGYNDGLGKPISFPLWTEASGFCTFGKTTPDLAITSQALWNSLHNRAQAQQIFPAGSSSNQIAAMGFRVVENMGCSLVHDAQCSAGTMFGVTTETAEMIVMPDRVWSWSGWEKVPGTDGYQAQFLLMGNFKFAAPRQLFKLYNLTA